MNCSDSCYWPELVKGLPAAFVALVIGVIAAGIAYRQYQVAQAKLKFDLFERRVKVYEASRSLLRDMLVVNLKQPFQLSKLNEFGAAITGANFLFGSEIDGFHRALWERGGRLATLEIQLLIPGEVVYGDVTERAIAQEETRGIRQKASEDLNGLSARYGGYLNLANWK